MGRRDRPTSRPGGLGSKSFLTNETAPTGGPTPHSRNPFPPWWSVKGLDRLRRRPAGPPLTDHQGGKNSAAIGGRDQNGTYSTTTATKSGQVYRFPRNQPPVRSAALPGPASAGVLVVAQMPAFGCGLGWCRGAAGEGFEGEFCKVGPLATFLSDRFGGDPPLTL